MSLAKRAEDLMLELVGILSASPAKDIHITIHKDRAAIIRNSRMDVLITVNEDSEGVPHSLSMTSPSNLLVPLGTALIEEVLCDGGIQPGDEHGLS